jgi:hypothetical protein
MKYYKFQPTIGTDENTLTTNITNPRRHGNFFFTTMSKSALGATQPPIQWEAGALILECKGYESSSSEVLECVKLYLQAPYMPL